MLIIEAVFPDGIKQHFGNPQDLYRYMTEEGYEDAVVDTKYVFHSVVKSKMSLAEIFRWATM